MMMPQSLEEAVGSWEQHRDAQFPYFSDIKVVTKPKSKSTNQGKNPKAQNLWAFFTDNKRIHAYLHKPDEIEKIFRQVAVPLFAKGAYGQDVRSELKDPQKLEQFLRMLAFHNKLSLLNHELLHPEACPNSKEDEKKIDKALYDGIKEAEPQLPAKDLVQKVGNVRNLVWDHTIDLFQYYFLTTNSHYRKNLEAVLASKNHHINGTAVTQFPEGIITLFDVVSTASVDKSGIHSSLYPLTRIFYATLMCGDEETRKGVYEHFMKTIKQLRNLDGRLFTEKAATDVMKRAILGTVSELRAPELAAKGLDRTRFEAAVDELFTDISGKQYQPAQRQVVDGLTAILMDKETRYRAIKGFVKPLAPYISTQKQEDRHQHEEQEEGGDGGASSALENLLDQLPKDEANQMLQDIANSGPAGNEKEAKLIFQAMDDYYKRNAKEIPLRSPKPEVTTLDLGKLKEWQLIRSETATEQELRENYNVDALLEFAAATGLPVLQKLGNNDWRINYFDEKELPLKSYTFQSTGIELPRNVVFVVDTSSSMQQGGTSLGFGGYVGTGNKYDALMHVVYGLLKTMDKAGKQFNAPIDVSNLNYSNTTRATGPTPVQDFLAQPASPAKINLLIPQNGITTLDALVLQGVEKQLQPGKTVWMVFCDGDLRGSLSSVFQQFNRLAQKKDNSIAYFQLYDQGGSFGNFMRQLAAGRDNVSHHYITDMNQVTKAAMSVLVKYNT